VVWRTRRRSMRLRVGRSPEVYRAHVPGVPPRPGLCEGGTGHRGEHIPPVLAAQPVRGGTGIRPSPRWAARRPRALRFPRACGARSFRPLRGTHGSAEFARVPE
jgi:hypothetical protein